MMVVVALIVVVDVVDDDVIAATTTIICSDVCSILITLYDIEVVSITDDVGVGITDMSSISSRCSCSSRSCEVMR
jgi:hypothetical protein